jgi:DNA-binding MarR family transcriptional regulator
MVAGIPIKDEEFLKCFRNGTTLTSMQIALLTGYDKSLITKRLKDLEKLGYVKRVGKLGNGIVWSKRQ